MASIFDLFEKIENESTNVKPVSYIIVGLGNPGREYERTRHNAGFIAIDAYCEKNGISVKNAKFNSLTGECRIGEHRVLIMKPQLYMNRSGECVRDAAAFYKIPPENILVISDDVNLDVGKIRIRRKGSDGGQKGLRDIIYHLNSDAFPRIRVGVGKLPSGGDMVNWVLGRIPSDLDKEFSESVSNTCEAIPLIASGKTDVAMGKFN